MVFDTDIFVWILRGSAKAAQMVNAAPSRELPVVSYMEAIEGARNKEEIAKIKATLSQYRFRVLPLTENIGHRASIYLETYRLAFGLDIEDALIAATAVENNLELATGNKKHFSPIDDLRLVLFRPE